MRLCLTLLRWSLRSVALPVMLLLSSQNVAHGSNELLHTTSAPASRSKTCLLDRKPHEGHELRR
jgi:hypothetical protein